MPPQIHLFTETPEKGVKDRSEKKRRMKVRRVFCHFPKQRGAHLEIRITSGDSPKGESAMLRPCLESFVTPSFRAARCHHLRPSPLAAPNFGRLLCGGAQEKERGGGTSSAKPWASRGEVSLLSGNPAPRGAASERQSDATGALSSSTLLLQTLPILARQACGRDFL